MDQHWIKFASLAWPTTAGGGYKTPAMADLEARHNVVHELGHSFMDGLGVSPKIPIGLETTDGFYPEPIGADFTWRQHPCTAASYSHCDSEVAADMYLGWVYGKWANDRSGIAREQFMIMNMAQWIR